MSIEKFVSQTFGKGTVKHLKAIRTGGDNNAKGNNFERHFTAYKVIEAWSDTNEPRSRESIRFTLQEQGFVDDLTIRDERQSAKFLKTNYQAKNSSGTSGSYSNPMHERFIFQEKIDQQFWGFQNSKQVLLVSCPRRASNNQKAIKRKKSKANSFASEFFPYEANHFELLTRCDELKRHLQRICAKTDLSSLDNGFRLVLAAMEGSQSFTLSTVVERVKQMSNPDIFNDTQENIVVPDWLIELCGSWRDITFVVKSRVIFVQLNGLEIRLSTEISEPSPAQRQGVKTKIDLVQLLMDLASEEFKAEKAQGE